MHHQLLVTVPFKSLTNMIYSKSLLASYVAQIFSSPSSQLAELHINLLKDRAVDLADILLQYEHKLEDREDLSSICQGSFKDFSELMYSLLLGELDNERDDSEDEIDMLLDICCEYLVSHNSANRCNTLFEFLIFLFFFFFLHIFSHTG